MRRKQWNRLNPHRVIAVLLVLLVAGCGGSNGDAAGPAAPTVSLTGRITIPIRLAATKAGAAGTTDCFGKAGFAYLKEGTQVTVRDQSDAIVALGRLERGAPNADVGSCSIELVVPDLPADRPFYTVQVADGNPLAFSLDELELLSWDMELSIDDLTSGAEPMGEMTVRVIVGSTASGAEVRATIGDVALSEDTRGPADLFGRRSSGLPWSISRSVSPGTPVSVSASVVEGAGRLDTILTCTVEVDGSVVERSVGQGPSAWCAVSAVVGDS